MSDRIECPSCGHEIILDQADYARLLEQVRTKVFDDEVAKRVDLEKRELLMACKKQYDEDIKRLSDENRKLSEVLSEERHKQELFSLSSSQKLDKALLEQREMMLKEQRRIQSELDYYKDLKTRMSTKMVGESLEQYCLDQFNAIRMTAFPQAYFEKDNDVRTGSKGDFIYREERDGVELLSIMFEMKNEMDQTVTKHKNEDFFRELDKDRREKGCEYAILVSLLESDSEYYNQGIVDVSYRYDKMYVVRPQCFLTMIGILRNAAMRSFDARYELKRMQEQNLDVVRFSDQLGMFKDYVVKNYDLASRHFEKAVEGIDKTIDQLSKIKKELLSSERNLRLLSDKTEDLTIHSLTKQSPDLRDRFSQAGILLK